MIRIVDSIHSRTLIANAAESEPVILGSKGAELHLLKRLQRNLGRFDYRTLVSFCI